MLRIARRVWGAAAGQPGLNLICPVSSLKGSPVATSTRPAVTLAWILGIALVFAAPGIVPAALTTIAWVMLHPIALGVALAATLVWCAARPQHRHRRGWA